MAALRTHPCPENTTFHAVTSEMVCAASQNRTGRQDDGKQYRLLAEAMAPLVDIYGPAQVPDIQ